MTSKAPAYSMAAAVSAVGIVILAGDTQASPPNRPGDLDTSFGPEGSGQITIDFGGGDRGTRIIVQPDGKYLAAGHGVGYVGYQRRGIGFLARYLPDGTPDTSFNGTGRRVFGYDEAEGMYLTDVLLQPDGKIVAVGGREIVPGVARGAVGGLVTRLNGDGSTDESFADGGQIVIRTTTVGFTPSLDAIAMLPDGRLLIAGSESSDNWRSDTWDFPVDERPFTLRLLANGQPDASYGSGGRVSHDSWAHNLVPRRIALQASGKVTVVGVDPSGFQPPFAIRLNGDGSPDTSFAGAGKYVPACASGLEDLLLEADGSLVMVGQWCAIRVTPSGQADVGGATTSAT